MGRGLTNVDHRQPLQMPGLDLLVPPLFPAAHPHPLNMHRQCSQGTHGRPPRSERSASPAAGPTPRSAARPAAAGWTAATAPRSLVPGWSAVGGDHGLGGHDEPPPSCRARSAADQRSARASSRSSPSRPMIGAGDERVEHASMGAVRLGDRGQLSGCAERLGWPARLGPGGRPGTPERRRRGRAGGWPVGAGCAGPDLGRPSARPALGPRARAAPAPRVDHHRPAERLGTRPVRPDRSVRSPASLAASDPGCWRAPAGCRAAPGAPRTGSLHLTLRHTRGSCLISPEKVPTPMVITPLFEQARRQAQSTRSTTAAPFHGVPLLLKDYLCQTTGDPYYAGMRYLRDLGWRSPQDTFLAQKFRAAGFIFLGKTNLPELARGPTTEPQAFGPTRNPWDPARSAGGSSGGSAAAVASGMVAVAHGNDGTGSLRIPASCCGLVGLKPSRGRISLGPGNSGGLLGNVIEFVLVRSVRDAAGILDTIAGPMPGDLFIAPPPGAYAQDICADPGRRRVGLLVHDPFLSQPVHPECTLAVERTGRFLESLGDSIEYSYPPAFEGPTGLGPALHQITAS